MGDMTNRRLVLSRRDRYPLHFIKSDGYSYIPFHDEWLTLAFLDVRGEQAMGQAKETIRMNQCI
jgi:hypothetical protein